MSDFENPDRSSESGVPASDAIHSDQNECVEPRTNPCTIGKAKYIPTVAILLIVHGVLMFLAGTALIGVMIFISPQVGQQIADQQKMQLQQNPNMPHFTKEGMTTMLYAMYGAMSACLFAIGVLNIFAGLRNYGYRNRVLGVISLVLNIGSVFFCWCLPLSIGLLIFGLIVYLSPEADRAFQWRSRSRERISPTQ